MGILRHASCNSWNFPSRFQMFQFCWNTLILSFRRPTTLASVSKSQIRVLCYQISKLLAEPLDLSIALAFQDCGVSSIFVVLLFPPFRNIDISFSRTEFEFLMLPTMRSCSPSIGVPDVSYHSGKLRFSIALHLHFSQNFSKTVLLLLPTIRVHYC